jgi:hypothetical protein
VPALPNMLDQNKNATDSTDFTDWLGQGAPVQTCHPLGFLNPWNPWRF